jgi:hypothetical protein
LVRRGLAQFVVVVTSTRSLELPVVATLLLRSVADRAEPPRQRRQAPPSAIPSADRDQGDPEPVESVIGFVDVAPDRDRYTRRNRGRATASTPAT